MDKAGTECCTTLFALLNLLTLILFGMILAVFIIFIIRNYYTLAFGMNYFPVDVILMIAIELLRLPRFHFLIKIQARPIKNEKVLKKITRS